MTTPFPFTSGQTLTAAQMNAITELPVNDKTASYTLTAAEAGERVIMNSASATTITVNTNLFTAGQVIYITNKGAGVCTVTAGTATVSTTGSLALAQYASGVLYCISAGVFIFEAYGVAAASSGLNLIATGTLTAAASVTVNTCFTSTYDEYLLLVDVQGTTSAILTLQMRNAGSTITAANYQFFRTGFTNGGAADNSSAVGQTSWTFGYANSTIPSVFRIDLYDPLTSRQHNHSAFGVSANAADTATAVYSTGMRYTAAQAFDSFVLTASAGTLTGTVRVYGYAK